VAPGRLWIRGQSCKLTGWREQQSIVGLSRPMSRIYGHRGRTAMSDQPRSLPDQPSLRYLKLEAKRRLSAGEFETLHDAQLAIAREHGFSSWNALRQVVEDRAEPAGYASAQLNWLISRFADADSTGWTPPADEEMREHFTDRFLSVIPQERVVRALASRAEELRDEVVLTSVESLRVRAQVGGVQIEAAVDPTESHRLGGLRVYPIGGKVADSRIAAPVSRTQGAPPAAVLQVADEAFAELGLVGLVLSAGGGSQPPADSWVVARGWADLDTAEPLRPEHRFPAYSITKLITATTVLRLVADGMVDLDRPANGYLRAVELADDEVTVRDLLSHQGGIGAGFPLFAGRVPDLADLAGPVLGSEGPRGEFKYSNGGYAALGQLVSDVTGRGYGEVATRLVLEPLGMTSSFFPSAWPGPGTDAISGYALADDGTLEPAGELVPTIPAAGGLWATAADLVRFGASWASLLPEELARAALTPQSSRPGGVQVGLGWHLNVRSYLAGHTGGGIGGATSLVVVLNHGRSHVAMTNRQVPAEPVNGRVMRALRLLD
jgi:CubicO group peptidase (beta-lactamase class C family)